LGAAIGFVLFLAVFMLPIYIGYKLGERKGRVGWAWGLLLGWLGVLILWLLSDKRSVAAPARGTTG
jgi:hypothetical protein